MNELKRELIEIAMEYVSNNGGKVDVDGVEISYKNNEIRISTENAK